MDKTDYQYEPAKASYAPAAGSALVPVCEWGNPHTGEPDYLLGKIVTPCDATMRAMFAGVAVFSPKFRKHPDGRIEFIGVDIVRCGPVAVDGVFSAQSVRAELRP